MHGARLYGVLVKGVCPPNSNNNYCEIQGKRLCRTKRRIQNNGFPPTGTIIRWTLGLSMHVGVRGRVSVFRSTFYTCRRS